MRNFGTRSDGQMKILVPNGTSYSKNHMTEEDTFIKLRRIPYSEMYRIYIAWFFNAREAKDVTRFHHNMDKLLEEHGWTRDEFSKNHKVTYPLT